MAPHSLVEPNTHLIIRGLIISAIIGLPRPFSSTFFSLAMALNKDFVAVVEVGYIAVVVFHDDH